MGGVWWVWVLVATPPSDETASRPPALPASTEEPAKDDAGVRRVAFDEDRPRERPADLRDPFEPAPPRTGSGPGRPSSAAVDLKDPFAEVPVQRATQTRLPTHEHAKDLRDPFDVDASPRNEAVAPNAACRSASTASGVPIQRPRALREQRTACEPTPSPPLRDPFVPPDGREAPPSGDE